MRRALVVLLAFVALLLSGCGSGRTITATDLSASHGYHGAYLDQPYAVPDVALRATRGGTYSLAEDAKRPLTVVFFGYTQCPDVCQVVMSNIASSMTRLDPAQQEKVQVVFVTTDPGRDTLPVLKDYLERFNPDFLGLTGSIDQVDAAGRPLHIFIKQGQKLPSGGYEVEHSTSVTAVVGEKGRLVWTQGTSPSEMAADMLRLLKS